MPLEIAQEAPNFDLTSTENALLMLRDEVARTAVLLYLFAEPAAATTRADLAALAAGRAGLAARGARVLGVSRAPLAALATLQRELALPFPLLHDDRDFSARYGVVAASAETPAPPALYLVGRDQRVVWLARPCGVVATALPAVLARLGTQGSPLASYPRSVINRFVARLAAR